MIYINIEIILPSETAIFFTITKIKYPKTVKELFCNEIYLPKLKKK